MKTGEWPGPLERCWILWCRLRDRTASFARRVNVVRNFYERWTTARLPEAVHSVLFVCKGNICRSPLAEAYFRSLVEKHGRPITVRSAGLETTSGKPAHSNAKAVALEHRLSLDGHATNQVDLELLDQSDLIIVMEIAQKELVQRLNPRSKGKVLLLGGFDSVGPLEITDPYSGTPEDFQSCFRQVSRCCDALAVRLIVNDRESGS
jgi:protein-tyrosine phosphatase